MKAATPLEDVKRFFSSINSKSRVGLLHHTDPDGVCSGVLAAYLLERLTGQKVLVRVNQPSNEVTINESTIKLFKQKKVTHVITTDMNVDENMKTLRKLTKICPVLVIDHHPLFAKNEKNLIMWKPPLFSKKNPSDYCAAKIVYDLGKKLGCPMIDKDWLAAIGLIGDIGARHFKPFMKEVFERHRIALKENYFDTRLGMCAKLISATDAYDWKKVGEAYDVAYKASSYRDIIKSSLRKAYEIIQKEITKYVDDILNAKSEDGLVVKKIVSPYMVKSKISTIVSLQKPSITVMLYQEKGENILVSLRRHDGKMAMNEIIEACLKGLKGMGGGHVPAAGATISKKDFPIFLKRVKGYHKKHGRRM